MLGHDGDDGIVPRLCRALFHRIEHEEATALGITHSTMQQRKVSYTVTISYIEIYNEQVRDLLVDKKEEKGLVVHLDPKLGPIIKDLKQKRVKSWEKVKDVLEVGERNRSTGATSMNERSSRSHAIIQVTIHQSEAVGKVRGTEVAKNLQSRINLVDLAGSEKILKSKVQGKGLTEAININKTLTTLGIPDLLRE